MSSNPLVSVLMTSYNSEAYVAEAIQSILAQTYTNWELLVADDCSTDNTRAVIDSFRDGRIKTHHNSKNLHYLRTRNRLIAVAQGDFITLLDSDDTSHPDRLRVQLSRFDDDPMLVLCGCHARYMNERGEDLEIQSTKPLTYGEILTYAQSANPFTGSSILIRTEILRSFGGYRDFFSGIGNEDYDLTSRVIERHKALNVRDVLYNYRQHSGSTSRSISVLDDPYRQHGDELVRFFIRERQTKGIDSLEAMDFVEIRNFIIDRHRPYVRDPSRLFRELSSQHMYSKLYQDAVSCSLQAIVKNPFLLANYRTLFYCLRKSTSGVLGG